MGDLVLKGATSGQITVTPTAIAGTNTLTVPATTGNLITSADSGTVTQAMLASNIAGNGPAFSAYRSTSQTGISSATYTKAQFNSTYFNIGSCFDAATNYRFTPNVAGYYQLAAAIFISGTGCNSAGSYLVKNGTTTFIYGGYSTGTGNIVSIINTIMYFNGSTDYVELFAAGAVTSGTVTFGYDASLMQFSGALVRAA